MKNIINIFKNLSVSGILIIYLKDKKIRIVNSSNIVSSIQRLLPELDGEEDIEIVSPNIMDTTIRSITCYIHKKRMEGLGYKVVKCSVKKWELYKKIELIEKHYKWMLYARNSYNSLVLGVFDKEEMEDFIKTYYPCNMISSVIVSSNSSTRRWYEIHQKR